METRFEWDADKARANLRKHGVTFETAARVFTDPWHLSELDRVEGGEQRWKTTGMVGGVTLLVVAHTIRDETDGWEVVRIISARRAERKERNRYEEEAR